MQPRLSLDLQKIMHQGVENIPKFLEEKSPDKKIKFLDDHEKYFPLLLKQLQQYDIKELNNDDLLLMTAHYFQVGILSSHELIEAKFEVDRYTKHQAKDTKHIVKCMSQATTYRYKIMHKANLTTCLAEGKKTLEILIKREAQSPEIDTLITWRKKLETCKANYIPTLESFYKKGVALEGAIPPDRLPALQPKEEYKGLIPFRLCQTSSGLFPEHHPIALNPPRVDHAKMVKMSLAKTGREV